MPIHDGFLIRPEDYETVAELDRCEFVARVGFDVKLNRKAD